ncbi:unnamed protein product [Arctogadus glacialis]
MRDTAKWCLKGSKLVIRVIRQGESVAMTSPISGDEDSIRPASLFPCLHHSSMHLLPFPPPSVCLVSLSSLPPSPETPARLTDGLLHSV